MPVAPTRRRLLRAGAAAAVVCGGWLALAASPAWGQSPASGQGAASPAVTVTLDDGRSQTYTREALERLPSETATVAVRDGAPFSVTGVSVTTLLRGAGLDLSQNLGGGQVVSKALVARAGDGYKAVFGLAEVDPHFAHPPLLVVWKNADGSALPDRVGPFQLISTGEKRPGRWVRQLQGLDVRSVP